MTLRAQGYGAHGWGQGRNRGLNRRTENGALARLEELHGRHGRTVSLVGWSLGCVYARRLARRRPDAVRQVITLGSPFRSDDPSPLSVPTTAIYSRSDGIVHWSRCIADEAAMHVENIAVRGSHSGLGHNPAVILAISDRLAQREGEWRPFRPPPRPPPGLSSLYPPPVWWEERTA